MPLFHETQHFSWIMNCIIILALLVVYKTIKNKQGFFFSAKSRTFLNVVSLVLIISILVIIETIKLGTIYYPDKITYQFNSIFATIPETVYRDSIKNVQVIKNNSQHWGANTSENNQTYNAGGDYLLLITLQNGKTIKLGTQQPDSLLQYLKGYYTIAN